MQDAHFAASSQLTAFFREKEEELEEKKKEYDAGLQRY
jgi:hypothetical protein